MSTPESPDNTILALSPPRVSEATEAVVGAHYGVPKHVYDLKPRGLRVDIDPALAGTVSPGDVIALVLNGRSEASKPIDPGEENTINTLYIPKNLLLADRINELVYTITRGSTNIGTSTPILTLLYNAIRPGMEDRTPGDGAHSELELILPQDVIDDGIDADRAKQGVQVCFSYPYCRAHDVICLNCNGQDVYRTVTVAEAPAIPSAEPTTLCVMVEEAVFERAGDHPNFTLSYTVTDQLGNGPDTDSRWSGPVLVDVHRNETRLVAPDLAEDPDDPSDDPRTIDLSKLGQKNLTVLVHTFAPQWQPKDKIRVTYRATPASGSVVAHTVEADVARIPFTYKLMVPNAKVIAGSVVRAKYELVRNGMVIATSKTTITEVSGAGSVDLLPPFLVAPAVSPIDVLAYPNGVTVRIEYLGALDGDKARLVEVNAPAGSPQFPLVAFNSNKRVNTMLTSAFLAARHSKNTELRWNFNRNGGQAGKSPGVKVSVLKIADGDPRLPTPNIAGETGDQLDIGKLPENASIHLSKWSFQETGKPLFLRLDGINKNGENIQKTIRNGEPHDSADDLMIAAPKDWLRTLRNESKLSITVAVNPDGITDLAKAVVFPARKYDVKLEPTILIENFDNEKETLISAGQHFEINSMKFSLLSGSLKAGLFAYFSEHLGMREGLGLASGIGFDGSSTQNFRLDFKTPCTSIKFAITDNSRPADFFFYNYELTKIGLEVAPAISGVGGNWIKFTAPKNEVISRMDVLARDYFILDFFTLTI